MFTLKSDKEILEIIGNKLKRRRLNKNFSQQKVANDAGVSIKAVRNAETGDSKLSTYIKIMRVLRALDELNNFLPDKKPSPKQLIAMQGKVKKKASTKWGKGKSKASGATLKASSVKGKADSLANNPLIPDEADVDRFFKAHTKFVVAKKKKSGEDK